ncbi:MAG: long-chain fatty acid--CoA ligase [Spirochaetes bacterium]|nr:long-chain fatty acid--CoA ligase [Spirochaetota bacterium]
MPSNVPEIFFKTVHTCPQKDALRIYRDDSLLSFSYKECGTKVEKLAKALFNTGIKAEDRVAILSDNMPEWSLSDLALLSIQAVVVPVYQTLPPQQISYILNDASCKAIFVQNTEQYEKIIKIQNEVPSLSLIFSFEKINSSILTFDDLIDSVLDDQGSWLSERIAGIEPEKTCSIVYTSGTTGDPKGVELNNAGFVHDIVESERVLTLYQDDVFLSFLPLSHLYERLAGHWCPMYRGGTIHYARSIKTVIEDISIAAPTVMVSAPRLFEKVASAVKDRAASGNILARMIFAWALSVGFRYHEKRVSGRAMLLLPLFYKIAWKLVFSKIKKKLGGRFRCPIAGGAPLSVETLKFFEAIDMRIIEGYGMTEAHLIITLTPPGKTRYGSCGKAIGGVSLKIADDGEVLVKGPTVMKGYYNKPELTSEIIDKEGWLHTGDIGYLDDDNYLYLVDRKKNIIVTSGGKNVAPAPIEHRLKKSKYINDICLVGSRRKFISALIIPEATELRRWAEDQGLADLTDNELCENDLVYLLYQDEINRLQNGLARFEMVKKFQILEEPLSIEKGEITPSMKIKRTVVEKNYKDLIDRMYDE